MRTSLCLLLHVGSHFSAAIERGSTGSGYLYLVLQGLVVPGALPMQRLLIGRDFRTSLFPRERDRHRRRKQEAVMLLRFQIWAGTRCVRRAPMEAG
ncbi:hypothetical protein GGS23DRAFT_571028 [Durotheca rogersii]|uniref:uncharacterized protein n=1 Tax=Durotheca rogersii TaxID=419775 RepID=UPI00221F8854|nr:uncharacterized protein GGS23DRAFT_571028 [Durotheca rogersii]KAI5862619.1 hypothetical protein GGS23DRAFT_571028 [Durotheca rogersii]